MIRPPGRWKSLLAVFLIFAAGIITGLGLAAVLAHWWLRPPRGKDAAEHMRQHFERSLDLSAEQKRLIDPILENTINTLSATRRDTVGRINHILDDSDAQLALQLNEHQVRCLRTMQERRRSYLQEIGPF